MKHQWMAYVIVALLSIGAGVAIAGLPNNVPVDATITPPTTTVAPEPTLPATSTTTTTVAPETTEPEETTPDTTDAPETTEPSDSVPAELPDRSEIIVAAANGAGIAGTAARAVIRLTDLGYVDVTPRDGTEIFEFTTIYYADGFEEAADRLANDLDLAPSFVAPLDEAPSVGNLAPDTQLLAYVGVDRAN